MGTIAKSIQTNRRGSRQTRNTSDVRNGTRSGVSSGTSNSARPIGGTTETSTSTKHAVTSTGSKNATTTSRDDIGNQITFVIELPSRQPVDPASLVGIGC